MATLQIGNRRNRLRSQPTDQKLMQNRGLRGKNRRILSWSGSKKKHTCGSGVGRKRQLRTNAGTRAASPLQTTGGGEPRGAVKTVERVNLVTHG